MPLLLDLCSKRAHGESPALIMPLSSTESLGESCLHSQALALHFSLAEAYRVTHQQKHCTALYIFHITSCR